jgi:hypothetical protein
MRKLPLGTKRNYLKLLIAAFLITLAFTEYSGTPAVLGAAGQTASPRTRLLINEDWRFIKGDPPNIATSLLYDVRPRLQVATQSQPHPLRRQRML